MKKIIFFAVLSFVFSAFSQEVLYIKQKGNTVFLKKTSFPEIKKKKHHRKRKAESFYIAKKKGKVFHRPDCRFAKRIKNKIILKSRRSALGKGYKPCKVCKP